MKLGLSVGYWGAGPPPGVEEMVDEAERLGFDSVWTSEAYGSDALTPLAWWGTRTQRMKLGTAIVQMSARTPAAVAMAAITMDHLSGGRFMLGIGASGPQVVEGWYGQPFPKPLARTREYVAIVRNILAREGPVEFEGEFYQLPHRGGTGLGKPLKSTVHPVRRDLPILLAAEGPKNVALAAEICDGWIPFFYSPFHDQHYRDALAEGFARDTARRTPDDFEVAGVVPVVIDDNVEAAADWIRPMLALYIGGMGARTQNFHRDVFVRMGFADVCDQITELYLGGEKQAAAAAVPTAMVEEVALVGPVAKLGDEVDAWKSSLLTTMIVAGPPAMLRQVAELIL
ncbi:MAG TPA: LLM class F420-dependent oxidoreductase [Candidatus Dormibacteraeota bacterium]|jgi:F420-dependent oxidoreductase-like protein|nr:LLM class F420-dependent oxidoreductase [Candidatus Dormibacteraeota bacterium]